MHIFKKFRLTFNSLPVKHEYQKIKKDQANLYFQLSLCTSIIVCLYTAGICIYTHHYKSMAIFIAISALCGIIWIFANKLKKFIDILLFGFCTLIITLVYLSISTKIPLVQTDEIPSSLFILGYICGSYERIMSLSIPRFRFKILFAFILFILRIALIHDVELAFQFYVLELFISSLLMDYIREREDKTLFQKFYDYREGLTKFKNLVVSSLPTNVLIMSKDLLKQLFTNNCIQKTAGLESLDCKTSLETLHKWLSHLIIDQLSLNDVSKSLDLTGECPKTSSFSKSLLCFLKELNNKNSEVIDQQRFLFNVKSQKTAGGSPPKAFEAQIFPLKWDQNDAIALILHDVTEQHQNLNLKAADSNKDKMLAMISHELRTPLNGILGVVNILNKEIKDPHQLRCLTICKNSGHLLLNLVNSILDLQQIRDNRFVLKPTRDNLHELLTGIFDLFKFQFDQKGLYLNLEISQDVPEQIITDQNRLRQILINLVGNAFKFTFEGGVDIIATLDHEREGFIHFKVKDTGTGIKEDDMNKLFKMYGRLDQTDPTANIQGVGLGLEISNRLARLLANTDGGIRVESQLGLGTTFFFSIRDNSVASKGSLSETQEINYHEPRIFAEDIEDISLKISPYFARDTMLLSSERVPFQTYQEPLTPNFDFRSTQSILQQATALSSFRSSTEQQITLRPLKQQLSQRRLRLNNRNLCISRAGGFVSPIFSYALKKGKSSDNYTFSPEKIKRARSNADSCENKIKVLVVDDNPFNLLVAKHLVERLGYEVFTVLNGQLAIEEVKKQVYGVILMDLQMPVMDGYEATKTLREMMKNKEVSEIPIIALSANDSKKDKKKCKEVGMYDHITKPLDEEHLKRVLHCVLSDDLYNSSFEEVDEIPS